MATTRLTLPYDANKAAVLKKEAMRQDRSFSNYLQTVFMDHLKAVTKGNRRRRVKK